MKHFRYHNVFLGIIVIYATVHISMPCTPEDHKKMQEEWSECSRRVTEEYSSDECQLVGGVIGECGKVWSNDMARVAQGGQQDGAKVAPTCGHVYFVLFPETGYHGFVFIISFRWPMKHAHACIMERYRSPWCSKMC